MTHQTIGILTVVAAALLLACSAGDRIASSKGGSETTNGIMASIHHSDGTPAAGSRIRLRRTDYVSRPPALARKAVDSSDFVTDQQGRFFITGIIPGEYCVEINDTAATAGKGEALLLTCAVDSDDTANLGTNLLHPYGTITGLVDTQGTGGRTLYAQVRGLERLTQVSADGSFTFTDLPGARLNVRIVDGTAGGAAREILNVNVVAGGTVTTKVSGAAAFSGYIFLTTAAAAVPFSGTISDFPLLVRLDSSTFDFSQALPGGDDVGFTKADGTPLSFEIEQWDGALPNAVIWVRIDTLYGGDADQCIMMHWGAPDATNQSNGTAVFDTACGFSGVWHLNEDPAAGPGAVKDRTVNGRHGTALGAMTGGSVVAGMIGPALAFDGSDDHIEAGILNLGGTYTISCWINAENLDTARRFIWKEFSYTLWYDAIGGGIRAEHFTDSLVWRGIYQDNSRLLPLAPDTWYHLAATYDGDKIRLYVNGQLADSTQTIGVDPLSSQQSLLLGGRSDKEFFYGIMDEVRIEHRTRPPEWIQLCYRNQNPDNIIVQFKR